MRPEPLFPLFAPVRTLPGVGAHLAALLDRLTGPRLIDLLWHLPTGIVDRRLVPATEVVRRNDGDAGGSHRGSSATAIAAPAVPGPLPRRGRRR